MHLTSWLKAGVAAAVLVGVAGVLYDSNHVNDSLRAGNTGAALAAGQPEKIEAKKAALREKLIVPMEFIQRGKAWEETPPEPVFADFASWAKGYLSAGEAERAKKEAGGVELARARLKAMSELIRTNPELALRRAIPADVRAKLPEAVRSLLEEPVNGRGDLEVICAYPLDGHGHEALRLMRRAIVGGKTYQVFTFGPAEAYVTHRDVPMQGVAVSADAGAGADGGENLLALDPNPARLLDASEVAAVVAQQGDGLRCTATGKPWTSENEPAAVELGGRIYPFVSAALAREWAEEQVANLRLDTPEAPANLDAASQYTEGRKRFILFRVDFPDYAGEVMTTNQALTLMSGMSNFMADVSYGKLVVAPVGQGSDITPTMRLPNNASNYQDMGVFLAACRTAATSLGYDMPQYDFYFVCTANQPSASFAGLGYVGGVGFWLANRYWDVRTGAHEFGHNLGLGHANWWNAGGKSMIGAGTSEEYGDPFDTMGGSGGGDRHFSSYSKNKLGWIPNADCPRVTASGFYRLYAHDGPVGTGVRGLRLTRNGGDYWVEYRQRWTGNTALMNGVGLRWVGGSTTLFDTTPGSSGNKDDHPLTIGRTFSDTVLGYHITPIGKGHTYPESIDVMVYVGSFPGNRPPDIRVGASAQTASTGQALVFTATASDPDGDALAYFWDFGDGTYSTNNQPVVTHSFSSAGEYYVECTASDMKGGTGSASVIVTVGSPRTYSISGRILSTNGLPVQGIKVSVDSTHYAFTESDGRYTITRLALGSYTVEAHEPVRDEQTFLNAFFNNPISVNTNQLAADFILWPGSLNLYTPLVVKGSNWRYLDDGSDPGTNWMVAGYDASRWSNGPAILGYGENNITTTINYGPSSTNKYISYYFRQFFNVANPAAFTNLQLQVLRDDGVIVYLNGQEVFRDNMPTGAVNYLTRAIAAVEPDNYLSTNLPANLLIAGTNLVAAEIHQVESTSSDVSFDLALSGLSVTNASGLAMVYMASPVSHQIFTAPTNLTLSATALSAGAPVTRVEFYANNNKLGEDTTAPYTLVWSNAPLGAHQLHVVAVMGASVMTSAPVAIEITTPPPPAVQVSLIPTGAVWFYFSGPTGAAPDWTGLNYSMPGWSYGPAELGYGEGDERTQVPYGGNANNKWITAYFRHTFIVNDPTAITNLAMKLKRDDGAIVYLNGVELYRDYLPSGPITPTTLSTNAVSDDGQIFVPVTLDPVYLRCGPNVLAVEIHQSAVTSSDLSFDLELTGLASTNRSRGLWLVSPTNGQIVSLPGVLVCRAEPVMGAGRSMSRLQYMANGAPVGEATAPPYIFVWSNPPAGNLQIVAVATDSVGEVVGSAPVNITVLAPPPGEQLISFGDVWQYLDDGSDQGSNWVQAGFDASGWKIAPAKFGYGDDGERTIVNYGTDANQRYITTYFRKSFTVTNPGRFDWLRLQLIRDDGAVVYLNGVEIFRNNIAAGLVSFNSLATNTIGGGDEITPVEAIIPASNLISGVNLIAVEIHQAGVNSSDLGFDLALRGERVTNIAQGVYLVTPGQQANYYAPAEVALEAFATASNAAVNRIEFYAGTSKVGEATGSPYTSVWSGVAAGNYTLTAVARLSSGQAMTSAPVNITVGMAPPSILPVFEEFIPAGAGWAYWDSATAVATNWNQPSFNDATWPVGNARFGWGLDGEVTTLTSGRVTHYFRRWFMVTNPVVFSALRFRLIRDDGAVVYLNGREVFRSNMPGGAITPTTLASSAVNTPDETTWFETVIPLAQAGLVAGNNLVAVELHQNSATSSDAGFDLQLLGMGTTAPRIYLTSPATNLSLYYGNSLTLSALAWPGSGRSVVRVDFYANGVLVGSATGSPYSFVWNQPQLGNYNLTAQMVDNTGAQVASETVNVSVSYQPLSMTLVSTGALWRYNDLGVDLGTAWRQRQYNDSTWSSNYARFGYGGDGEVTTLNYGSNSSQKRPTYYFRRWFVINEQAAVTNLTFRLLRDDGAVVYLDGVEVFRSNMPAGTISYNTLASSSVGGTDEQTYFVSSFPVIGLLPGSHLLAVEVHQAALNSSDLSFDLQLDATGYIGPIPTPSLAAVSRDGLQLRFIAPADALVWKLYYTTNLGPEAVWLPATDATLIETNGIRTYWTPFNRFRAFYRLKPE